MTKVAVANIKRRESYSAGTRCLAFGHCDFAVFCAKLARDEGRTVGRLRHLVTRTVGRSDTSPTGQLVDPDSCRSGTYL
jgi:hypothetical protein